MKEYAFSAEKTLPVTADPLMKETKPRAENPSARMIRLRPVDNVRSWFSVFMYRKSALRIHW
jgi:hypothetical protein